MQKRKLKLSKPPKNVVLALLSSPKNIAISLVTAIIIISGSNAIFQRLTSQTSETLTREEITAREEMINRNSDLEYDKEDTNKVEGETINGLTVGGIMLLTSIGSASFIEYRKLKQKKKDNATKNYRLILKQNNNSVIGSKVKNSFHTYR